MEGANFSSLVPVRYSYHHICFILILAFSLHKIIVVCTLPSPLCILLPAHDDKEQALRRSSSLSLLYPPPSPRRHRAGLAQILARIPSTMSSFGPQNPLAEMKQHLVMLPFMAQGHIIPFLHLSNLIAARSGFTVTIVNTPLNIQSLRPKIESERQAKPALDIRLAELPFSAPDHGLPPCSENTDSLPNHLIRTLLEASEHLQPHFERLIHQICQEDGRPPLCIISDISLGWTLDVAYMFGIPNLPFCTCGVYGLLISYSLWTHLPHTKTDSDEFVLPDMPNVSLHRSQLNEALKTATGSDRWASFHIRQISRNMRSWGFIYNTFEDLEHNSLEHMRKSAGRPMWAVGPLLPSLFLCSSPQPSAEDKSVFIVLRGNEAESDGVACLRWLDSHEPSTVLYVSFGTQNTISVSPMRELALGLESSGVPFVWVVRPPLGVPLNSEFSTEFLPNGLEERIKKKNQGLLVKGWAPQLMILSHPSTGGFLSHCGWNSVLENVSQGVPIIGWPMAGEQFYNSKLLEEVGVCVEMWRGKEGELSKEKVEKTVRTLMREEKGRGMREKAIQIRDAARKAASEGQDHENKKGSSTRDLDDMIEELLTTACERQSSFG